MTAETDAERAHHHAGGMGLSRWLAVAGNSIEVLTDDPEDMTLPQPEVEGWPCAVWVTNGRSGNDWYGALVARCEDRTHAELVAIALRELAKAVRAGDAAWP